MRQTVIRITGVVAVVLLGGFFYGNLAGADAAAPAADSQVTRVAAAVPATATPAATPNANWSMWGGSTTRNNTPVGHNVPTEWKIGSFNYETGEWNPKGSKNIKWVAKLGSQSYGNPVIHNGKIFVGTNNTGGFLKRYPSEVDLGCLLCFDEKTGKFLWQHSSEKLPTGRVHDWPLQGICSTPICEGDRLWFVTSRGEVRCLDTEGFRDNQNDGPYTQENPVAPDEADVVWDFDMMKELHISQHNMCSCSPLIVGDVLFICTSNGVDLDHKYIPAPEAPSFVALDKNTGKVLWTDNSPGNNIHHGQWSSPGYGVIDGQAQILFGGGDGWLYSFDPKGEKGKSKLLWKFDTNPKKAKLELMGKGTRNDIIGTPVVYENRVYVATGQDPEHGEGVGILWCIDPTKRGDVSSELAFNAADPKTPIAHKRVQAVVETEGDFVRDNPNSAVVWKYEGFDKDGDGELAFEETMHRTCGTATIRDGILYIADFSGLFHCLDARTGKVNWVYDMLSAAWGSSLVVEDKVYVGDEDGEVSVFRHSADPNEAMREEDGEMVPYYGTSAMDASVYTTPVVAGNVLYISSLTHLFAISPDGK